MDRFRAEKFWNSDSDLYLSCENSELNSNLDVDMFDFSSASNYLLIYFLSLTSKNLAPQSGYSLQLTVTWRDEFESSRKVRVTHGHWTRKQRSNMCLSSSGGLT